MGSDCIFALVGVRFRIAVLPPSIAWGFAAWFVRDLEKTSLSTLLGR